MSGHARAIAARFPLVIAVSIAAFILSLVFMESKKDPSIDLIRTLLMFVLCIPLLLAVKLFCEHTRPNKRTSALYYLVAIAGTVGFYFTYNEAQTMVYWYRFAQFELAVHLAVAFALFVPRGSVAGFWRFNQVLFIRFLTTALYSSVIFAGLAIALRGTEFLFGFHVRDRTYGHLAAFVGFVFNTWFFLGGVPHPEDVNGDESLVYPRGVKLFTQYVLVPLVTIYFLILYAYLIKIIGTASWPNGTVGYLVSGLSLLGMLSILLVYPIQNRDDSKWVTSFSKWFYIALLPLLILLLAADWRRIDQYGITEPRYFLLILCLWIFGVSLYFIFRGRRDIRMIPISLCAVALLTGYGPWGAYQVSRYSQYQRLEYALSSADLLKDHTRVKNAPSKDRMRADENEIRSIISYLNNTHGTYLAERLFPEFVSNSVKTKGDREALTRDMMHALDLATPVNDVQWGSRDYNAPGIQDHVSIVSGFDMRVGLVMRAKSDAKGEESVFIPGETKPIIIRGILEEKKISIRLVQRNEVIEIALDDFIEHLHKTARRESSDFVLKKSSPHMAVQLNVYRVSTHSSADIKHLTSLTGELLIKVIK